MRRSQRTHGLPRHPARTVVAAIGLLALLLALFAASLAVSTAATEPRLRLRPNDGPPGATALARGRHFAPHATGTVTWDDGSVLAEFETDKNGEFEVKITIPQTAAGAHDVTAQSGDDDATDSFAVEAPSDSGSNTTGASEPTASSTEASGAHAEGPTPPSPSSASEGCPSQYVRRVDVSNAAELESALANAQPGDLIRLADGAYVGNFVAATSGTSTDRIVVCGTRNAIIDGGDVGNGYALHLTADYWTIHGITVSNALKGVMLDGASYNVLDQLAVHTIGHEAVHFRTHSAHNVIQDSEIHDTGLKKEKFGEGVYLGSAVSNWGRYTDGAPDRSDRNQVLRNRIWNTTAENIDIKEGTTGGLIEGNVLDGSMLSGADSWIDAKGNAYIVRSNIGRNSPVDGYQTHVINDMDWGRDNLFDQNSAEVNGSGYGFYIHDPEESNNTVRCSNQVNGASSGFANVECS